MFYRRKLLLALIEIFENSISKIELQKYLFLITGSQKKPAYDFVPCKYGCYSFTLASDLSILESQNILCLNEDTVTKTGDESYCSQLDLHDRSVIKNIFRKSKDFKTVDDLIRYTYNLAPCFAINSEIKEKLLDTEELEKVNKFKPKENSISLSTIGYEGISIETYINRLIKNNIKCLVDVRKNPRSIKFGFSEKRFKSICEEVGIKYVSIRELGIETGKRAKLETQKDYDDLFKEYINDNLSLTKDSQLHVLKLLREYKRVALTCFEKDINKCHRKILSEYIREKYHPVNSIEHI